MSAAPALIVEDLPEIREWFSGLLGRVFPGLTTVTASTLQDAISLIESGREFRIALVDLGLPDGSGLDAIQALQLRSPQTPVIVTTVHDDDANLFRALSLGASGYLLKEQDDAQLIQQLRLLQQGQPPLSPRIARRMLQHFKLCPATTTTEDVTLSPRETQVLSAIGRGLRVNETAERLGLAESTVASYIKNIYVKLNISSRAEAALEAVRRGLT